MDTNDERKKDITETNSGSEAMHSHAAGTSPDSGRRRITPMRVATLAAVAAGGAFLLSAGLREPPMLNERMVGEPDGYRLETGRATPAKAQGLSGDFVPASERRRQAVLEGLAEFRSAWKTLGPSVEISVTDVQGDAVPFAEQVQGWLRTQNVVVVEAENAIPEMAGAPGATVPSPPIHGFILRCREEDEAMARNLALALAPVLGGEVNIIFDERVSDSRLRVAINGAPSFNENGVAYFPAA